MPGSAIGRWWIPSRTAVLVAVTAALLASVLPTLPTAAPVHATDPEEKPNLLFIMTDDQRIGTVRSMPNVRENFPVNFSNAFATTPLCCPARASTLTGTYAHRHKVRTTFDYPTFRAREKRSLAPWLRARGYYTGLVGKYLNRYRSGHGVPPGWDEFSALTLHPDPDRRGNDYTRFWLRERWPVAGSALHDGVVWYPNETHPEVYSTTLFGDRAEEFLVRAKASGKPWALFLWLNAPHAPWVPEEKYANAEVARLNPPPSFMERNMRDKPLQVRKRTFNDSRFHRGVRAAQLRLLMSVDDVVGELFDRIDTLDMRDNTWGIFTSDNGYFWGEHRLTQKHYGFEESVRVPFRMTVPGMDPTRIKAMVANIDVAPTLMKLAKDPTARRYDGRSLLPLLDGTRKRLRSALPIEGWELGTRTFSHFRAFRTGRWKYVLWVRSGNRELYNLRQDPYELKNLLKAKKPAVRRAARRVAKKLHAQMRKIRARPPAPLPS